MKYINDFKVLGSGFALYFHWKKFTIILFFLWIIMVSIPLMALNRTAEGNDENDREI